MRNILLFVVMLGLSISCTITKDTPMVESSLYGKLPDGREVYQYTMRNSTGSVVKIINYGCIVTNIIVPDRNGKLEDVVLGFDSLQGYVQDKSFIGTTVGRYGNRIGKGQFTLDDVKYQLTVNDGVNHLHGGRVGFFKALWKAQPVKDSKEPAVEMTLVSPDGDEGYPGTLTMKVVFTLTDANGLRIDYSGTTDKATILNATHHSYFNISGNPNNTILDNVLTIEADSITPVDQGLIPTGVIMSVDKTPMDFRTPTAVGARINEPFEQLQFGKGYDHNWVLRNQDGKLHKAVELYDQKSGRVLSVFTDQPGMQFYSGNFLDGSSKGKGGIAYQLRTALCLEPQHYPDSPNKPQFPSVTLRPGQTYHQTAVYQFSTK